MKNMNHAPIAADSQIPEDLKQRRQFLKTMAGTAIGATAALSLGAAKPIVHPTSMGADHLNVRDYGAVGDGKTDDTESILRAVAAANKGTARVVYFPLGIYVVSQTIPLTLPITLRGAGELVSTLITKNATDHVIDVTSAGVNIQFLGFQTTVPRTAGAYVNFGSQNTYQNSLYHFAMSGAYIGVNMAVGWGLWIEYGSIRDGASTPGSAPITITGGNDHYIRGVTVDNAATAQPSAGIWVQGSGAINLTDVDIIHCNTDLYITGGASIYAINSYFDTAVNGIIIDPKQAVVRCHFIGCWTSSHTECGVVLRGGTQPIGDIDFIGHHCFLNAHNGFQIDQGMDIQIANSSIAQNGGTGIALGAGASGCRITNNMIGSTGTLNGNANGITIDSAAKNNFITGNRIVGNTTAQISGTGVGNSIHVNMGVDV